LILLTILCALSLTAFGQKEAVKTKTDTKPVDAKTATVKMPTVQEILANYVKAIGGKEANEKIKSRMSKGTVELSPMGVKGTFENYAAAPNKSSTKISLAGIGEFFDVYDGVSAWAVNPLQGSREKQGEELAQAKLTNTFNRETNLAKIYPKLELKGIEKVGADDAYVVTGSVANLPPDTFYFDTKSGLLVRQDTTAIAPEGNTPGKTYLEDYRTIDGVKVPFRTRSVLPQFELVTTFTEIKNNVPVEDAKFSKPKA
jgi:hypothetical protein